MNIFKSIFRLDYPVNYIIIDHLGEQFDLLVNILKNDGYEMVQSAYDASSHSIRIMAEHQNNFYNLEVTPISISGVIEYKKGKSIEGPNNEKFFKAIDLLLSKIEILKKWQFERIGLREFYIIENRGIFTFKKILGKILDSNKKLILDLNPAKSTISDIAFVIEIDNEFGLKNSVKFGPYKDSEKRRYFKNINPNIAEGLIIDLDSSLFKYNIPDFKFSEFSKKAQLGANNIVKKISDNLRKYNNE